MSIKQLPKLTNPLPLRSVAKPGEFTATVEKTLTELQSALVALNGDFIPKANAMATTVAASEAAAKSSATNAKTSETAAKTGQTAAKTSETAAKTSQTAAKTSETNAKASETAAKASQTAAKTSETACLAAQQNLTGGGTHLPTGGRLMLRDASGRAQVADPTAAAEIANKRYVDALGTTVSAAANNLVAHKEQTNPHSATSSVVAGRLILRDASGRARIADPAEAAEIANKRYVDALGTTVSAAANNLVAHKEQTNPHSATSSVVAGRLMLRDASGRARVADPAEAAEIANKRYVDGLRANGKLGSCLFLSEESNLDDLLDEGWYFANSGVVADWPLGVNGFLYVKPAANRVKQWAYRYGTPGVSDHETATRTRNTGGDWGAWTRIDAQAGWAQSFGRSGWQKLPSGLILQWGKSDFPSATTQVDVTFPTAFPNAALSVVSADYRGDLAATRVCLVCPGGTLSKTGAQFCANDGGAGAFYWQAIGH